MAENMRNDAAVRAELAQVVLGGEGADLASIQAEAANTAAEECLTAEERKLLGPTAGDGAAREDLGTATASLLDGIPQKGIWLGDPNAPVVMIEFVDMQCPFCRRFALDVLPTLIDEYVRPGQLRVAFRGISFIGPDSEKAVRAVYAAGEQDRLWHVEHMLFEQQGGENSGWVTDELLSQIADATPGLDPERLLADTTSAAVAAQIDDAARAADAASVTGTPSFLIGPPDDLRPFQPQSLTPDAFRPVLDERLGR
jgi:protein-disulfide isomerase